MYLQETLPAARVWPGRLYYGWLVVLVAAAAAMAGTLPERTQGLGLMTEPLTVPASAVGPAGANK